MPDDKRFKVKSDDDGHWYLIDAELEAEFDHLCWEVDDDYEQFNEKFYNNMLGGSPESITFSNPK